MEAKRERDHVWPERLSWLTPSVVVLVGANLFPLYGVLFQGWQVFPIVLLFWLENVVVGVFFILRFVAASPGEDAASLTKMEYWMGWVVKLFLVPFFIFHYGMFTLVHGVFVFALFGREMGQVEPSVSLVLTAIARYSLVPAVVALALSHAFSYAWNFIGRGEFRGADLGALMWAPYGRMAVLHVAIIGGAFLVMMLKSPVAGLVMLLILKICLDVTAHLREHRKAVAPEAGSERSHSAS